MESKARYHGYEPVLGILSVKVGKLTMQQLESLERLREKDLDLVLKVHREKRSLDSNAYLWVLCTKIADVVRSSKDEIYEEMLQKYGYVSDITITVKSEVDMTKIDGHWKFLKSNGKFSAYLMIRGSSEYNGLEMQKFLDMVVLEAKELGIETATPKELEQMNRLWKEKYGSEF